MAYHLRTLDHQHSVELPLGTSSVGTAQDCAVPIQASLGLAERHFSIRLTGGLSLLEDHTGGQHTLVNGCPVQQHRLSDGDIIRAGALTLVFSADAEPLSEPMPAVAVDPERAYPVPPPVMERPISSPVSALPAPPVPADARRPTTSLPLPKPPVPEAPASFFSSADAPLRLTHTSPVPPVSALLPPLRPEEPSTTYFAPSSGPPPTPAWTVDLPLPGTSQKKAPLPSFQTIPSGAQHMAKTRSTRPLLLALLFLASCGAVGYFFRAPLLDAVPVEWQMKAAQGKSWLTGLLAKK